MDINFLRGIFTLIVMVGFIGMFFWVYSKKRRDLYDEAAHSILNEDKEAPKGDNNNE